MAVLRVSSRFSLNILQGVLLALLLTLEPRPIHAVGVRTVTVTAPGFGMSQAEAAQNAAVNAVAMV